MKAVADASSLLSLEYMGILDDALNIMEIYTTGSVSKELKEIAGFRDEKSGIAKKILHLVKDNKIKCLDAKVGSHSKYASMEQCLYLCMTAKIPVILTDDADAAYFPDRIVSQKGVKLRMCASVLVELIKAGKISPSSARGKLEGLIKKRSWEGGVLEVLVRRYMQENER